MLPDPVLLKKARTHLEWDALLQTLAHFASFTDTGRKLSELTPFAEEEFAKREACLDATSEMLKVVDNSLGYFQYQALDLGETLGSLRLGRTLSGQELWTIHELLEAAIRSESFAKAKGWPQRKESYPELFLWAEQLQPPHQLFERLSRSIDAEGQVLDSASPELGRIRQALASAEKQLVLALERFMRQKEVREALQDQVWMQRDSHYVLPVRTDRKSSVDGNTVGVSASGNTLFIEPSAVAGAQTALARARSEEQIAIQKILNELSRACLTAQPNLQKAADVLIHLDELGARAQLARVLGGCRPQLHSDRKKARFSLKRARHPLFVLEQAECVANDLHLIHQRNTSNQKEQQPPLVTVLSGPNAGGKTVTMKTLGLFALMAQSGLYVSAEAAEIYTFDCVFAAIGDTQNREENLSTFSGHLLNLKRILQAATNKSLVLLDEGFVGTDPNMGAALARAVLESLAHRGVCTIITTHFSQLKGLAEADTRFFNASMEFEARQLSPTYQFLPGIPGQSYAFELAQRLGFESGLLDRAREYYGSESQKLEKLLMELQIAKSEVEEEKNKHQALRVALENLQRESKSEVSSLKKMKEELLSRYQDDLQKRLNSYRNTLETRERQFERQKKRRLQEMEDDFELRLLQIEEEKKKGRDKEQTKSHPTEKKPQADASKKERDPRPPLKKEAAQLKAPLKDFESLKNLRIGGASRKASGKTHSRREKPLSEISENLDDLFEEALFEEEKLQGELEQLNHQFRDDVDVLLQLAGEEEKAQSRKNELEKIDNQRKTTLGQHAAEEFQPGVKITCARFRGQGEVQGKPNARGMVFCSFGLVKSRIHFSELKIVSSITPKTSGTSQSSMPTAAQMRGSGKSRAHATSTPRAIADPDIPPVVALPMYTIDLRGCAADVAIEKLDLFLDKAEREDLPHVIVLHGHGQGAVKKACRQHIQTLPIACRYRPGTQGEGGDGVTVLVFGDNAGHS